MRLETTPYLEGALGVLRVLHERGVRVPEDPAVVGLDDIEDGLCSSPSLRTVRPSKQPIPQLAVKLLAGRLDESDTGPAQRQNRRAPASSSPRSAR